MSAPNWLGLLKWSLQQTDGTTPSEHQEMSEEDRAWLKEALKNLVRDDVERMTEIMNEIKKASTPEAGEVDYETLIDELRDITEQIDMASVFVKIGGVHSLLGVLHHGGGDVSTEAKALAAGAISTIVQNNPQAQTTLLQGADVLPQLYQAFRQTSDAIVKTRVLQAVSSLVRGIPAEEEALATGDEGLAMLRESVSSADTRLQTKGVFVSKVLVLSDSASAQRILHLLPVACDAIPLVAADDVDLREQTHGLLLSLCRRGAGARLKELGGDLLTHKVAEAVAQAESDHEAASEEDKHSALLQLQLIGELRDALATSSSSTLASDTVTALSVV